jgi:hypothetical protein
MPSIVNDVSAIFVDTTIFLPVQAKVGVQNVSTSCQCDAAARGMKKRSDNRERKQWQCSKYENR